MHIVKVTVDLLQHVSSMQKVTWHINCQ